MNVLPRRAKRKPRRKVRHMDLVMLAAIAETLDLLARKLREICGR